MSATGRKLAIAGAGLMGTGIAQVLLHAGWEVALYDPDEAALASAPQRVGAVFSLLECDRHEALTRLRACKRLAHAVEGAEIVIEAGPERLAVKQAAFEQLDRLTPEGTILASNTSSLPVAEIGARVQRPSRVIGAHFWNPPYLVPLVEVVQAERTDESVAERTMTILKDAGMEPVLLHADVPGFVGNRLQHALKREAIALLAAGVCDAEAIDTVVKSGFGLRLPHIGPLEQSDMIGLDLTLAIHQTLMPSLDNTPQPHPLLVDRVAKGELGMASGKGFRSWTPEQAEAVRRRVADGLLEAARRKHA